MGEILTDLAQDIRKLMVLAYPCSPNKTMEMVERDSIFEALDVVELVIHTEEAYEPCFGSSRGSAHGGRAPFC